MVLGALAALMEIDTGVIDSVFIQIANINDTDLLI
jgi:hypothetical protein